MSVNLHQVSQCYSSVTISYIFYLQGMLFASSECVNTPGKFVRLWMHEATRVYCDKLVDVKDQDVFGKLCLDNIKKIFAVCIEIFKLYFKYLLKVIIT